MSLFVGRGLVCHCLWVNMSVFGFMGAGVSVYFQGLMCQCLCSEVDVSVFECRGLTCQCLGSEVDVSVFVCRGVDVSVYVCRG